MDEYEEFRDAFEKTFQPKLIVKPLTTASLRAKEVELHLLSCLKDSDEAIDPLVELWMHEREDAAHSLSVMQDDCSPGLVVEEIQLLRMIEDYGRDWVEPMSRLALLLFIKSRYDEAIEMCYDVLSAKPWHFEAGQLLVASYLRKEQYGRALEAARRHTLPKLNSRTNDKRRRAWVAQHCTRAREWLETAQDAKEALAHDDFSEECPIGEECWN